MPRIADLPASQLIRFLAAYGPDENNQNLFDENAQRASRINRIDSFDLEAKDVPKIVEILKGSGPVSVLIAGVAGDGKSYHLRQVWRELDGSPEAWEKTPEPVLPVMAPDYGWRQVHFINDLSAYDKGNRFSELWQQLCTAGAGHAYVIACNHGKILQCLRAAGNPEGIADRLEDFFFKADETERIGRLRLFDLSRTSQAKNLEKIFALICSQSKWGACESERCEYLQGCPIRKNLELLWDRTEGKPTAVTKRLCELVRLAAFDGIHFPIRELFILAVNALLGKSSASQKAKGATADCHLVRRMRRKEIDPVEVNAFRNLLGRNLKDRVRLKKSLFRLLDLFEIGRYSDPFFDNLILTGKTSEEPDKRSLFQKYLGDLPEMPAQEDCEDWNDYWAKRSAWLAEARARLFFRWEEPGTADVWALTAYRHAGKFLKLREQIFRNSNPNQGLPNTITEGLNRTFTGYPCDDQYLCITTNGAESRTPAGDLIVGALSTDPDEEKAVIRPSGNKPDAVPVLVFQPRPRAGEAPITLQLTPRRYEFLCGVAEGALPASFSEQCQAELFALKATLIQACLKKNTCRDAVQLKLINAERTERFDIRTSEVLKDKEED